ncbi:14837_t:CDS:10 [Rhizophagus irregularis]|nr:14837_t:CDS:10 [Rhizophagus irregularis]
MPKSRQSAPLAQPPPLYQTSQTQTSNQSLSIAQQISPLPFSPTHQSRKVPRSLDTSNSDFSEFLLPPQTGLSSPTTSTIQSPFSPGLTSPYFSRRSYPGTSNFILGSQRAFIQRKTLTEIQFFTNTQYNQLKFLCSSRTISPYDSEVWGVMLGSEKFPTTNSGQDAYDVEMATVSLAIEFASNNKKTANFNTLLLHTLSQMRRVIDSEIHGEIPIEAYNSLFLVRVFSKHFIGNLSRDEINQQFEGDHTILADTPKFNGVESKIDENNRVQIDLNPKKLIIDPEVIQDTRSKAEQLMDGLLKVILKLDPIIYVNSYCISSDFVNSLTKRLVTNFIEQKPSPPASTSVVYNAYSYLFPSRSSATLPSDPPPISERSLLVLLLLSVQCRAPDEKAKSFREGIRSLKDAQGMGGGDMAISFRALYQLICRQLPNEEICLLLYLLMIENEEFRVYVLSRLDPEILLLQILRLLYDGIEGRTNYSQMYILLTILLLFSQDEVFNENIQKISISYQPWFTERLLKSVSLGGLTYLVLIRVIQFNLSSHRDVYFHNNCLATMANLGNSIQDIHPYVAQRLVNLFDIVAKRYQKLREKAQQQGEDENSDAVAIYEANLKSPSAEEISELIETAARTWPPGRLKEFPDLKFQYEEELESQEFFCPYVWALIYRHTWIYWDENKTHILNDYIIHEEMEASSVQVV